MKDTLLSLRDGRPPLENAMTLRGESCKEATSPIPFLSTKEIFNSQNVEREDHI